MRRAAALVLAAAALLGLAAGLLLHRARTAQPEAAQRAASDETSVPGSGAVARLARDATQRRTEQGDPPAAGRGATASPPHASYREQLASAKRVFAVETRDSEWAARTEAQLRAAIERGQSARAPSLALGGNLEVECRTSFCRLSVPIPPGQGIASLPIVAEMADTLQRAASAIEALGRIVGENVEPSDPRQSRHYALYLRRHLPDATR